MCRIVFHQTSPPNQVFRRKTRPASLVENDVPHRVQPSLRATFRRQNTRTMQQDWWSTMRHIVFHQRNVTETRARALEKQVRLVEHDVPHRVRPILLRNSRAVLQNPARKLGGTRNGASCSTKLAGGILRQNTRIMQQGRWNTMRHIVFHQRGVKDSPARALGKHGRLVVPPVLLHNSHALPQNPARKLGGTRCAASCSTKLAGGILRQNTRIMQHWWNMMRHIVFHQRGVKESPAKALEKQVRLVEHDVPHRVPPILLHNSRALPQNPARKLGGNRCGTSCSGKLACFLACSALPARSNKAGGTRCTAS